MRAGRCSSSETMEVNGHGRIERQKLKWRNVQQKHMKEKGVRIEEAQD